MRARQGVCACERERQREGGKRDGKIVAVCLSHKGRQLKLVKSILIP